MEKKKKEGEKEREKKRRGWKEKERGKEEGSQPLSLEFGRDSKAGRRAGKLYSGKRDDFRYWSQYSETVSMGKLLAG